MLVSDQVKWAPFDFLVAGALIAGTGTAFELAARKVRGFAYRAGAGLALFAALSLVWVNLAVGFIGDEGNPANLMYVGVLAVGVVGAIVARGRPRGMASALFATAAAQALVGVIAYAFRLGGTEDAPLLILGLHGVWVAMFAASGLLFRRADTNQARAAVASTR
jgi:hypothetical protein